MQTEFTEGDGVTLPPPALLVVKWQTPAIEEYCVVTRVIPDDDPAIRRRHRREDLVLRRDVTVTTGAVAIVGHVPRIILTWFDVVPTNDEPPVPQLPAPWSSVHTMAIWPLL